MQEPAADQLLLQVPAYIRCGAQSGKNFARSKKGDFIHETVMKLPYETPDTNVCLHVTIAHTP